MTCIYNICCIFIIYNKCCMKKEPIKLSKLELVVMRPFWGRDEITVREVADQLKGAEDDPGYSTVQTIAGRLEKKGAIEKTRKVGKAWLFRAVVGKKSIVGRMMDEILSLFDGAPNPILSHLVESEKIGEEELEEIRAMIASKAEKEEAEHHD